MSLPALATSTDLRALIGDVDDEGRARALLDFASALIRTEAGVDWVDEDDELDGVPDIVRFVCCKVVERVLSNPTGLQAESVVNYRAEYGNASSDLYLTKQERRLVRKAAGKLAVAAVGTTRNELETPEVREFDYDWDLDEL
jgi:hypothetical protein